MVPRCESRIRGSISELPTPNGRSVTTGPSGRRGSHNEPNKGVVKYQIVIPKEIRSSAGVRVGQKFQVIAKGGIITLVPDKPISAMRGFVRGIRTTGFREKKDRI